MRFVNYLTISVLFFIILTSNTSAQSHKWSRAESVPGLKAYQGHVSAAWHDNILHVITNDRSKNIKHAQKVNGQWIAPVSLAHNHSGLVPAIAVAGKKLHMVTKPGDFKIGHSIWDGRAWSNAVDIPDMESRNRAEITGMSGIIHLTHGGLNNDKKRVWYASNAGWGWGHNVSLPDQRARYTASMAGLDGTLHMVYVSKNSDTAWHTTRSRWGEWTEPVQIPGVETGRFIDLVTANNRLFMVFTAGTSKYDGKQAPVSYCEWNNGRWSTPETIEGYVCYGAPAAAVKPGLPQQIHLFLPTKEGVLHIYTEDKVSFAPVKRKVMKRAK